MLFLHSPAAHDGYYVLQDMGIAKTSIALVPAFVHNIVPDEKPPPYFTGTPPKI